MSKHTEVSNNKRALPPPVWGEKWSDTCENPQRGGTVGEESQTADNNEQGGRERQRQPRLMLSPLLHLSTAPPLAKDNQKPDSKGNLLLFSRKHLPVFGRLEKGAWGTNRTCPRTGKLDQVDIKGLEAFLWRAGMGKYLHFPSVPTYPVTRISKKCNFKGTIKILRYKNNIIVSNLGFPTILRFSLIQILIKFWLN